MLPTVIHLYGPLAINSFGLFIVIGLLVFSWLFLRDPRRKAIIPTDIYFNGLSTTVIVGLLGARLLYVITHWQNMHSWIDIIAVWHGGFSLLGAFISCLIVIPYYLKKYHINIVALMDLAALYLPLLQAISRIGCFFAGCCFGIPTTNLFGLINAQCPVLEFINKPLHPTQLYSSVALFGIFITLFYVQKYCTKSGQLITLYLFLMSAERFITDFWRGDRELIMASPFFTLSIAQIMAACIALIALIAYAHITLTQRHAPYESL